MNEFFAHSANRHGVWEPLSLHLRAVAATARSFGQPLAIGKEAELAGLLHDLGKYGNPFQERVRGHGAGVDHWAAGAWVALRKYEEQGVIIALAVQGHHVGLQQSDHDSLRALDPRILSLHHPLSLRLSVEDPKQATAQLKADGLALPDNVFGDDTSFLRRQPVPAMLDARLLFSCLVDADYLETEAHFDAPGPATRFSRPPAIALQPERALAIVLHEIDRLRGQQTASTEVQTVRDDLLAASFSAAEHPTGLFTLTAPTGSGKTLAMLAFAMRHAAQHALRRVVIVLPYLTIIDQTASIARRLFADALGEGYLLEHHSLVTHGQAEGIADGEEGATQTASAHRALVENWDAPLIITTSVQLLESMFANRPAACRKLHRLARSVILFDEVQTLPNPIVVPTLAALSHHSQRYGSSIVFATATQPAFGHMDRDISSHSSSGWRPTEIVPPALRLFERTRRVSVKWPDLTRPVTWPELAEQLLDRGSALCVVNLRRHARELVEAIRTSGAQDLHHLSTAMCPAHRSRVLEAVRGKLDRKEPTILVATQCVEAGVDLDFPAAFRAFGPLDAIAQVAGRCNRHGTLPGSGVLEVFLPADERYPPGGGYGQAAGTARSLLRELGPDRMDIDDPTLFTRYYRDLYDLIDPGRQKPDLLDAIKRRDFAEVGRLYRVIDEATVNVLVPYDVAAFDRLRSELTIAGRLTARWVQQARLHAINLYRSAVAKTPNLEPAPMPRGSANSDWYLYLEAQDYSPLLGLVVPDIFMV